MSTVRPEPQLLSVAELADQTDVTLEYVLRLIELGALEPKDGDVTYASSDVGRVRLLHAWEEAGRAAEGIMELVNAGELSISWLDTPVHDQGEASGRDLRTALLREACVARVGPEPARSHRIRPSRTQRLHPGG